MLTSQSGERRRPWARTLLAIVAGGLLMAHWQCSGGGGDAPSGGAPGPQGGGPSASANAIARENQLPGSSGWRVVNPEQNGEIAAYADRESYPAGATVSLSVTASPAGQFTYEVFRMGSYRGMGGRLYASGGPIFAPNQPAPSFDPTTGLVRAGWPTTFSFPTRHADGTPWLTGVYLVMLTKQDGFQSAALFILRDDTRDAEVAAHFPTATYQAYNDWGGESLYVSSRGLSGGKARKVSLDRPIARQYGNGTGTFLYQEREAVVWLEENGYDVEYGGTADLGGPNGRIGTHRLLMLIGHEEYATMEQFDRLEDAVNRGVNLAFLTGNTMYWQIRYENNGRVIVCYKDAFEEDPIYRTNPRLTTVRFGSPIVNRPENQLIGVMSDGSHIETPHDWVVTNADHWFYANTGLTNGSRIPRLVFTEWDGLMNNGLTPPGITVLASSVVPNPFTPGSRHEATLYERNGAFVFAAGTIFYSTHLRDQPVVGRMTANLLARAGARRYEAD